ncbi:MAG: hypothetical protein PVF93_08425 [Chromatiaceae bacterium]|jgi:hypothetical protein
MTALLNPDLEDALWDGDLAYIIRDAVVVAANPGKITNSHDANDLLTQRAPDFEDLTDERVFLLP